MDGSRPEIIDIAGNENVSRILAETLSVKEMS